MTPEERGVYEKLLAAHLAARRAPRLGPDEFLRALLTPEERASEAYRTYDLLKGRSPEFAAFLLGELGYSDPETAWVALGAHYGRPLEARIETYRRTGR